MHGSRACAVFRQHAKTGTNERRLRPPPILRWICARAPPIFAARAVLYTPPCTLMRPPIFPSARPPGFFFCLFLSKNLFAFCFVSGLLKPGRAATPFQTLADLTRIGMYPKQIVKMGRHNMLERLDVCPAKMEGKEGASSSSGST